MQITSQNYKKLLKKIEQAVSKTKKNIVKSLNRQKVEMSWKTGQEIDVHLKKNKDFSYKEKLFDQLTGDTSIDKTTLYKMYAFFKTYPQLLSKEKALSWRHYRNLIAVKDAETSASLESLVVEKNLGTDKLQHAISQEKKMKRKNSRKKISDKPLSRPTKGRLFTYSLNKAGEVDLGFNIFVSNKKLTTTKTRTDLHTYLATLERVVDGDTILVKIDFGCGIFHREKLRLAKIDAAEITTKAGKQTTNELNKILRNITSLIVKTNKTDIYGRYIADVFFDESGQEKNPQEIFEKGIYLNQLLLERKLVVRY
ncbi:MAG: DUF1016 family protein [Alphaproteobacteria bacterium]|nr:DUF1016 family protein [Alphaproteobacteria bacterium]